MLNQNVLEKLFKDYIADCEYSKGLSPATISSYKDVFRTFHTIMPEVKILEDVHPQMFNEFFRRINTRERKVGRDTIKRGIKQSTTRTYYNKLIAFYSWLERYGYLEKGSITKKVIKPKSPQYDDERALKQSEVNKIMTAITLNTLKDEFIRSRDMAIILILLYTGIRKGELLGLRIQDVDFESQNIYVRAETSKSKKSRHIPMHFSLITHLKSYLKRRKEKGFSTSKLIVSSRQDKGLTQHGLKFWVTKYSKLSGISFHIHRFRHTFACTLGKNNVDIISIMNMLGHSTTRMTEQYLRSIKTTISRDFINKISY